MGYGVDYMMGSHKWHGIAPNDEELERALEQLNVLPANGNKSLYNIISSAKSIIGKRYLRGQLSNPISNVSIFVIPSLMNKSRKMSSEIPFGPYIIIGCIIYVSFSNEITNFLF